MKRQTWIERLEYRAALSVACVCGAAPGEPCRDEQDGDFASFVHRSRRFESSLPRGTASPS